ncbi:hypothetical protein [Cesiribacter sp. SM1]|uniref:hypothetical protein n=1 Tax=Cesiribacter sp. SM1 TaxID=2861196 RepID=UPI001CD667B7|nr:hypothetical protein [Cesiribacter sp. SM1]
MIDIFLIARDEFDPSVILNPDEFLDHYLFEDEDENLSLAHMTLNNKEEIELLIKYLFNSLEPVSVKHETDQIEIIDISDLKSSIASYEQLKEYYRDWINESGRDSHMDEYGALLSIIGYVQRNQDKKNLLIVNDKKRLCLTTE